jgi:hypothetical protein
VALSSCTFASSCTFLPICQIPEVLLFRCLFVRLLDCLTFLSMSPSLCSIISVFSFNLILSDWTSRCLSLLHFSSFAFLNAIISVCTYLCGALLSIFRAASTLFRTLLSCPNKTLSFSLTFVVGVFIRSRSIVCAI